MNAQLHTDVIANEVADCLKNRAFTFSMFQANNCDLRKTYTFEDGKITKGEEANMHSGQAWTEQVNNLKELNAYIEQLKPNQALMSGVFPVDECRLTTSGYENPSIGLYSRTKKCAFPPQGNYIQLLDNDPHRDGVTFETADDFITYLHELDPVFKELEILVRPSSSAGIHYQGNYKNPVPSWHGFVIVDAGFPMAELEEYFRAACWGKGDGYIMLAKNGHMLERCTFDLNVFSPERPIFEAEPKLLNGVERTKYATAYQAGRI